MAIFRRLNLFSWLVAAVLVLASAAPPLALWSCRHASRVISAAAPLSAMPCRIGDMRMGDMQMGGMPRMACCPTEVAVSPHSPHSSAFTRPACSATLTYFAALPPASASETHAHWQRSLAAVALSQTSPFLPSIPATLPLRQRPPPSLGFCQSALKHSPGLRAPPAA